MTSSELGRIEATITATIRPCTEADLPALEWMGLYAPHRRIIRDTFKAQQRGDALMLLAVARGFPVAQVWIDFSARGRTAVLWAVRTFFPLQRAGIGARMMRAAEEVARRRGFAQAELEVEKGEEEAIAFYRRLGWRTAGESGDGRRLMTKEIARM